MNTEIKTHYVANRTDSEKKQTAKKKQYKKQKEAKKAIKV